ncbi:MAG: subclass B3 metallo-beta-lactamase [Terriglobales bacterium]
MKNQAVRRLVALVFLIPVFVAMAASAQGPDWTEPFPPFRIAANLYYIGSHGLANFLVTTPQGNILINCDMAANVPMLESSIRQLGFRFRDTKIILISHAHWDHDAACGSIRQITGARYMVMAQDVPVVESGGRADFDYGNVAADQYPRAKVDRALHDGDTVRLGGTVLVAHLTPGHTRGCTTWTLNVTEGDRTYHVVIVGSTSVNPGYKLVNNRSYPGIARDYERTFRVLRSLPCDIFLGAHGSYFDLPAKFAALQAGHPQAFVDPAGYAAFVNEAERTFQAELTKQRSGK